MNDLGELIKTFVVFIVGIFILSELVRMASVDIPGLQFGPLLLGVFIVIGFIWFLRRLLDGF